jgi:hypothetical protein
MRIATMSSAQPKLHSPSVPASLCVVLAGLAIAAGPPAAGRGEAPGSTIEMLLVEAATSGAGAARRVAVGIPDFARGPGQSMRLPLRVEGGERLRSLKLTLSYDPRYLRVLDCSPGADSPSESRLEAAHDDAEGCFALTWQGELPGDGLERTLAVIEAEVPPDAPYRAKHSLRFLDLSANDGAAATASGEPLHLVAYPGDATGNGGLSAFDAQRILRLAAGRDRALSKFPQVDARLIADVDGDLGVTRRDAALVLSEAVGIDVPEIPPLPGILALIVEPGPDPRVEIPKDLEGPPGGAVHAPLLLDQADRLEAADIEIAYDTAAVAIDGESKVQIGSLVRDFYSESERLFLASIDPEAGSLRAGIAVLEPHVPGGGSLLEVEYSIEAGAAAGETIINLSRASLNEDGLVLTPEPQAAAGDPTDGRIVVKPAVTGAGYKRGDANADGQVNIADASYLLNWLFLGGPDLPCLLAGDSNGDRQVNIADASYGLNWLFLGGPDIPKPNACGEEPLAPVEDCAAYPPCAR